MKKLYGLISNCFPKPTRALVDQDYCDKLSDSDRCWLSQFNDEYYGGKFAKGQPPIHRTAKQRRDCYNASNARRRCVFTLAACTRRLFKLLEEK